MVLNNRALNLAVEILSEACASLSKAQITHMELTVSVSEPEVKSNHNGRIPRSLSYHRSPGHSGPFHGRPV